MPTGQLKKLRHPAQLGPALQPLFGGEQHLNTSTDTHRYRYSHTHGDGGYTVSENAQRPVGAAADHTVALGTRPLLPHRTQAAHGAALGMPRGSP